MSSGRDDFERHSIETPFDNETNGFVSENAQEAIEELAAVGATSASPGFNYGRSGNISANTWLYVTGSVSSNLAGITVALSGVAVKQVYVANQNINTFDIEVYEHEGDEVNITFLGSVTVTAARTGFFAVDFPATVGKQLAIKLTNGSARNISVGLQLKGNF